MAYKGWGEIPEHVWGCAENCVEDKLEDRPEFCHEGFLEIYQRLRRWLGQGAHVVLVRCEKLGDYIASRTQHTGLDRGGYDR